MHGKYALLNHIGIQGNSTTVHPKEIVRGMVIRVVEFSSGGWLYWFRCHIHRSKTLILSHPVQMLLGIERIELLALYIQWVYFLNIFHSRENCPCCNIAYIRKSNIGVCQKPLSGPNHGLNSSLAPFFVDYTELLNYPKIADLSRTKYLSENGTSIQK